MPETISVHITRTHPEAIDLPLPAYATDGSAGMDIHAAVDKDVTIPPGKSALIPTGFSIALPNGYEAQVRPRSGPAAKHGVTVLNAPGTIDSDYRGEVKVILINHGSAPFVVARGDRIAQLVVQRYVRVAWDEVSALALSARGEGGFGHTGISQGGIPTNASSKAS